MATDPREVVRLAAESKRAARIAAVAAELRDEAQQAFDALVSAQHAELTTHQIHLDALQAYEMRAKAAHDAALAHAQETTRALNALHDQRTSTVQLHLETVAKNSEQLAELQPQLDVAYWADQAAARVAADEATGA